MGLLVLFLLLLFTGCQPLSQDSQGVRPLPPPSGVTQRPSSATSTGQTLYIPCYSHVYLQDGRPYNLSITLSLRNTSLKHNLVVKSVEYYDSAGKLLKKYAEEETVLGPLATTEYFVEENDPSGGSGANFLVTWYSEDSEPLDQPIVQALMVGTSGNIGVSFLTDARILGEGASPQAPMSSSPTPSPPSQ